VELGFAVSDGAFEHSGDFIVLVPFNIVQNEDEAVTGGQVGDGALESEAINGSAEGEVWRAEASSWSVGLSGLHGLIERGELKAFFAEVHEDDVDGESMEPGGEGRIAAEGCDLAVKLQEGFLGEVFSLSDVVDHAEAEGIDAALVLGVELRECLMVTGLSAGEDILWQGRRRDRDGWTLDDLGIRGRLWRLRFGLLHAPERSGSRHTNPLFANAAHHRA